MVQVPLRALLVVLIAVAAVGAQAPGRADSASFLNHIKFLAGDDLGGRGNGTPGLEQAGQYIAEQFKSAGLEPGFGTSYFQPFDAEVRIEPSTSSTLTIVAPGADAGQQVLALGTAYYPLSVVDRLDGLPPPSLRNAAVVFAGYGISAPGRGYDDYAGVDVRDAAVVVFTHEPQEENARSVFDGTSLTPGSSIATKAQEARSRGARLLIVVDDPAHAQDRAMRPVWWNDPQSDVLGLPVVRVARDRLSAALPGLNLRALAADIDRTLVPQSRRLAAVTLSYTEQRANLRARLGNVVGVLRGANAALAGQVVVIGAHYDHVGTGGEHSMAPEDTGAIHNGADDNASGTAALLEMARIAAAERARFARTLVFVAFSGEELGLIGSEYYATHPVASLANTVGMVNLDMIGRAHGRVLMGIFHPSRWTRGLDVRLRSRTRLKVLDITRNGFPAGASDEASFTLRGVPTASFFTGFHADYHRPGDDWQKIDAEGGAAIADLALRVVEIAARTGR